MQVHVKQGFIQEADDEAIVVNLFEGVKQPGGATGAVDRATRGLISEVIGAGDFKGKLNEVLILYPRGGVAAKRVLLVGLGKPEEFDLDKARQAAGAVAKRARDLGLKTFTTIVHGAGVGGLDPATAAQATVEGSILALYRFKGPKELKPEEAHEVEVLTVLEADAKKLPAVEAGARAAQVIAEAVYLTRDLQNWPANYATPTFLAETARRVAAETGMRCQVLEREDMEELGMGALLGVARGSQEPPKFIILEHKPNADDLPTVVLVGKGITFDSGGISIKPSKGMEEMKFDMSGGAAVIGAMQAVARLDLPLHVVGLVPATENLPSGTAQKPGDVVRTLNGKTIEVVNTDAEGRLILADALAYAQRYKPAGVIDLATLTGACVVALGKHRSGLMGNDDDLKAKLKAAGEATGELVWELPLDEAYREQIESDVADMKNTGGGPAGAITAAMLLKEFTDYPWAHLDIAGTAWSDKDRPYVPKGGTGVGVRLLVEVLRKWSS